MKIEISDLIRLMNQVREDDSESPLSISSTDLFADKGVDSLTLASFYFAVEEKYSVSIPDNVLPKIRTMTDMKNFLEGNLN